MTNQSAFASGGKKKSEPSPTPGPSTPNALAMASAALARSTGASFLSARSWASIPSSSPLAPAPFPFAGPSRLPPASRLADPPIASRTFSTSQVCAAQAADFYSVLNVPRTASQTDIKRQFYQLSKRYHPDVNRDDDDAKRKFQEVSEAYATLGQERSRRAYDAGRSSSSSSSYAQYNTSGGASSMNAERRARAAYAWDYTRRRSDSSRARAARGASDAHSSGRQAFGGFGRGGAGPETSFGTQDEHPADRLERLAERERRRQRARTAAGGGSGGDGGDSDRFSRSTGSGSAVQEGEHGNDVSAVVRFCQGAGIFLVVLWLGTVGMRIVGLGGRSPDERTRSRGRASASA